MAVREEKTGARNKNTKIVKLLFCMKPSEVSGDNTMAVRGEKAGARNTHIDSIVMDLVKLGLMVQDMVQLGHIMEDLV